LHLSTYVFEKHGDNPFPKARLSLKVKNMSTSTAWLLSIFIFLLLLCSALFSASETSLTAVPKARIHQLIKKRKKSAQLVSVLQRRMDKLISSILLGNTFVNIAATSLATSVFIKLFDENGVGIATVAMTLLILLIGEVMPKIYAINNLEKVSLFVAPLVFMFIKVFGPLTDMIRWIAKLMWRLLGVKIKPSLEWISTREELKNLIELYTTSKMKTERAMLRSILDLSSITVGEAMVHRKEALMIDAEDSLEIIIEQVLESHFTRIPVWKGTPDNIIGILHLKSLLEEIKKHEGLFKNIQITKLLRAPWFIPDSTPLLKQLQSFKQKREHLAIVVDEYGTFEGILTLEDILEEIVGNIADEYDVSLTGITPQPDGSYHIEGSISIRVLNREFEWSLPEENATTLAGLLIYEAREIPKVGDTFEFHGFRFEVLKRHRHQITLIKLCPLLKNQADEYKEEIL
jgi:Mg2+/Co2+ transporter CorB